MVPEVIKCDHLIPLAWSVRAIMWPWGGHAPRSSGLRPRKDVSMEPALRRGGQSGMNC
jgi:hypothetical protein